MSLGKTILAFCFVAIGCGLCVAGLGVAGVLKEYGLDIGGVFSNMTPHQTSGYATVAIGVMTMLLGTTIIGSGSKEHEYDEHDREE